MILNKSIKPCEGEISVKSYLCSKFNSRLFGIKADGYVEVTNKRLLFQAYGTTRSGYSVIHNEVAIGDVSEIKVYKGTSFSIAVFITGIVICLLLSSVIKALFIAIRWDVFGTLVALAGLIYGIYRVYFASFKDSFSLLINTKGGDGNVVYLAGLSPFGGHNTAAARALAAEPGRDSEMMMKEIGALIMDIQNLGEDAINKWKA